MFTKSIRITARTLGTGPQVVYIVVRGHEVGKASPMAAGLTLPSGYESYESYESWCDATRICSRTLMGDAPPR